MHFALEHWRKKNKKKFEKNKNNKKETNSVKLQKAVLKHLPKYYLGHMQYILWSTDSDKGDFGLSEVGKNKKKCNLTLAMSPACHSNSAFAI